MFPKGAIIRLWRSLKEIYLGIKEDVSLRLEVAKVVASLTTGYPERSLITSTSVTDTDGTLRSSAVCSAMQKLMNDYEHLNLNGLAEDLGITKEGVQRLIWLCADASDIKGGSRKYSPEMITHVRNALYAERILKQTTFRLASLQSWTKKELPLTKLQWLAPDYGIRTMGVPSVVNATAI